MTERLDPPGKTRAPGWDQARWGSQTGNSGGAPRRENSRDDDNRENALSRFLGGSPWAVFLRLLVVSLVVGALLMWLEIRPMDIFYGIERFFQRIWMLGFDALRELGTYILAGAVIVVPVWLILRLMNMRRG